MKRENPFGLKNKLKGHLKVWWIAQISLCVLDRFSQISFDVRRLHQSSAPLWDGSRWTRRMSRLDKLSTKKAFLDQNSSQTDALGEFISENWNSGEQTLMKFVVQKSTKSGRSATHRNRQKMNGLRKEKLILNEQKERVNVVVWKVAFWIIFRQRRNPSSCSSKRRLGN